MGQEKKQDNGHEKRAVALYSILAAIGMIAGKGTVGLMTGSLAILTDALHSLLDMGASVITYFAVRISDKPADRDHHFGHGKVESLAALAQVIILLITCVWIIHEAVIRLSAETSPVELNIWAFIVIIGSIAIDITRVRALRRVAKKYKSQALEADALNFSTDIYSSLVVLFGLGGVYLGYPLADAFAAIGVAVFIIIATVKLAKQSIDVLLDRAPLDTEGKIREIVVREPEILAVNNLRLRSDGRTTFAEIMLDVDRSITFARASALKEILRNRVLTELEDVDVTCSFRPVSSQSEAITDAITFSVSSFGFPMHHLLINKAKGRYFVSMHLEMPGDVKLNDAHDKASEITEALHEAIPDLEKVVIYTQPLQAHQLYDISQSHDKEWISRRVKEIIESFPNVGDCHNINLTSRGEGLALSADMRLDGQMMLDETEMTSIEVQKKLRAEIEELISITLHLEPFK
ncbi:MAG: cation diffusion facilitator family transporter [candidate division Zixibacteria bacterium]|nr:cation diffusion facilitator family transporter [candidate division Zixibacteria bacterium]